MPTLQVYLEQSVYARLVRIAEGKIGEDGKPFTASRLAALALTEVAALTANGRTARRRLEVPEP